MKFILYGDVILSKEAFKAKNDIQNFIQEANQELFQKGVPRDQKDDASRIVDWNLEGKILHLKMVSGRRGRAHDAILRIKKPLTQLLGSRYHIGVRKILVKNYQIEIPIAKEPELDKTTGIIKVGEIDLDATIIDKIIDMPYVSDSKMVEDKIIIEFEELKEADLRKHVVDRVLKFIKESRPESTTEVGTSVEVTKPTDILTKQVTKIEPGTIISTSKKQKIFFEEDPTEEAARQGWVKKFPGKGQWFYGPQFIALQRVIEDAFLEKLVDELKFEECMWPKLIPIPVMNKMRYLEGLPEGMYYCSAPRRDPEIFEKFKKELIIKKEVPINRLKDGLKDPSYVLAPAQCEPFYEFFSHEVLDEKDLPIKLFDRSGWTYRWEAGGSRGLDRVHEFQRVELVWIGTPDQVEKLRNYTVELSQSLAD